MKPELNLLDQFIASRVKTRFAAKSKGGAAPPKELTESFKKAIGKMESVIKSKMGKPFELINVVEYEDDLLTASFWGPKKKGTKSSVPEEPFGRFSVQLSFVKSDGTVDIDVRYLAWDKKKRGFDFDADKDNEAGVALDKAADVAVKLLGEVAGRASLLLTRKAGII
jgi:hypothetical protein